MERIAAVEDLGRANVSLATRWIHTSASNLTDRAEHMIGKSSAVTVELEVLQNGCIDIDFRRSGHGMSTVSSTV